MSGNDSYITLMFILTLCLAMWSTLSNKTIANGKYVTFVLLNKIPDP